jgi:hypothetical protein
MFHNKAHIWKIHLQYNVNVIVFMYLIDKYQCTLIMSLHLYFYHMSTLSLYMAIYKYYNCKQGILIL